MLAAMRSSRKLRNANAARSGSRSPADFERVRVHLVLYRLRKTARFSRTAVSPKPSEGPGLEREFHQRRPGALGYYAAYAAALSSIGLQTNS